ncbi:MAG: radical SAM/SPASM domain-containing protein [Verrucomicrobiota bacterium]
MKRAKFLTGLAKAAIYARIIIHVPVYYLRRREYFDSAGAYFRFLRRALTLLMIFRHNKVVRVFNGYKLHLYLPAYPSKAFFYALESKLLRKKPGATTVVFSMTKACTYKCRHCYQRHDTGSDMDEDLLIQTALDVRDSGAAMFDIEGGEPFVRFGRLLKLVSALDERSEVWINTTGANVEPGMMEKLKEQGLFGLMVSLHSPDATVHDELTGIVGSFETACGILRQCREMGLVAAFNTVLSEKEIEAGGIDRIMDLARKLDCDYVQLIHPKPAGMWLGRKEDMQTDSSVIDKVRNEHLRYNSRSKKDYPSLAAQVFEESSDVLGCTAGAVDRFYIGASGEVQPCEFLNISFGNVNDESFSDIYERMRSYFSEPCTDWLCCTQAASIAEVFRKRKNNAAPLPWDETKDLVERWNRGSPTPIYRRIGIYR